MAILAAVLPVALARIPGFTDMPSHMARHHILAETGQNPALDALFAVHWRWIANLGVDLPAVALSGILGTENATRLVAGLIAPLTLVGIFALSRAVHGRIAPSAFIASALVFNQAWMWGFQNFGLGTAGALLVAAWMIAYPQRSLAGQMLLALLALVVWTAHLGSWGILLVIAAGTELAALRRLSDIRSGLGRTWPLFVPLLPLLAWRVKAEGAASGIAYGPFVANKITVFATIFKGTTKPFDLALLAALLVGGLLAWLWAKPREQPLSRVEPRMLCAGLLLTGATLAAPITIFNAWGTDLRCAPFAVLLLILSIPPPANSRNERVLIALGLALFCARLGVITRDWVTQSAQLEKRLALLDSVPIGSRMGYLFVWPRCGYLWHLDPETKLGSYAVTRRDAFAGSLFQVMNADIVSVRDTRLAARWHDGTQNRMPICPGDSVDLAALRQNLVAMHGDGLGSVWVSGLPPAQLPAGAGFHLARAIGNDSLLLRDTD